MDKWESLKKSIQELYEGNTGTIREILRYILNLMKVLEEK